RPCARLTCSSIPAYPRAFLLTPVSNPSITLFPYTTLFRSKERRHAGERRQLWSRRVAAHLMAPARGRFAVARLFCFLLSPMSLRSEEHTSELQSRFDLVCRLLLEKKNKHVLANDSTKLNRA